MSSSRFDFGGVALFMIVVVFAVTALMVVSSGNPMSPRGGALVDGGAGTGPTATSEIPVEHRPHPQAVALTSLPPARPYTLPPKVTGTGPAPGPTDFPFGTNVAVWTDPAAQRRPSVAIDSQGRVYVAFETDATPANVDIMVAYSDNNGTSWSTPVAVSVPGLGANERNPNVIVTSGDVVTVFFEQDVDPNIFYWGQSTNRGVSFQVFGLDFTGLPFQNFQFPSFVAYGTGAYGALQMFCTDPTNCGGGASSLLTLGNTAVTDITMWRGFYFVTTPDFELFHPAAGYLPGTREIVGATEYEVVDNLQYDIFIYRYVVGSSPPTVSFDEALCGPNCPSSTFVWPAIAVDGTRVLAGGHFLSSALAPVSVLMGMWSPDGGATTYRLAGSNGRFDTEATEQKYLALDMQGTRAIASYRKGTALFQETSNNGGQAFVSPPARVSDNSPGTVIDLARADSIVNSSSGPMVAWQDSRDGNPNIYFAGIQRFTLTINTIPANLQVRFGTGPWQTAPASALVAAGTPQAIEAQNPQPGGAGLQYAFTQWNDAVRTNPRMVTLLGDATFTASFATQYQITIVSNPAGRTVTVNGGAQTAPYSFWCNASAQATLDAPSPQPESATSQWRFGTWSDGGAQNHQIACDRAKTVTGTFIHQFQITLATNPAGRTVVVDSQNQTGPYAFWCDEGSPHIVSAPGGQVTGPGTQYRFDTWSDSGSQTHSVTCSAAMTITANFVLQYQITIATNPAGRAVTVNGVPQVGPYTTWYDAGGNIGLLVPSPQSAGTGTRYSFSAWSDGNTNPSRTIQADMPKTVTAIFTTEYFLTMSANPVGTVSPGNGWHPENDVVPISTNGPLDGLQDRYRFGSWSGSITSYSASTTILMDGPKTIQANWVHQYRIEIQSNGPGAQITVDGTVTPVPIVTWFNESSTHTLVAQASIVVGPTERWGFASWTGGGVNPTFQFTVSGAATYSAQYTHQYLVKLRILGGGTVTVDGNAVTAASTDFWWDDTSSHTLDAGPRTQLGVLAGVRYVFAQWDGSAPISRNYAVSASATLTATYDTQYFLTVTSDYPGWACSGAQETTATGCWYTSGTTASVTVTTPYQASGSKYAFTGWSGAFSGGGSATVSMDGPKAIAAGWRAVSFVEEYGVILGILIAIIVAIVLVLLFLMMRRRKKEPSAPAPMAPAPGRYQAGPPAGGAQQVGATMACPACGMEIPAGSTTCPVCGAAV